MITRISERIHEWMGWCPNAPMQNTPRTGISGPGFPTVIPPDDRPAGSGTGSAIYSHSAPTFIGGIKLVLPMVCIAVAGAVIATIAHVPWIYLSPFVVGAAYLGIQSLYSTVHVAVSPDTLEYWFGRGFRRNRIALAEIARCSVVENPANFGWSIRATFLEWFYNVSGPDVVEILLIDGKTIRIGTDEPEQLAQAIRDAGMITGIRRS